MDEAPGDETTIFNLTRRILNLNFAAIHTSTQVHLFLFPNSVNVNNKNVV